LYYIYGRLFDDEGVDKITVLKMRGLYKITVGNGLPYFGADRRREEERAGMGPRETSSP